jgi:hypothetical protein
MPIADSDRVVFDHGDLVHAECEARSADAARTGDGGTVAPPSDGATDDGP